MTQLPTWAQYVNALGTLIIAAAVGVIALLQWRTAHQRVVLDLFERRMKIIDELLRVVAEILIHGAVQSNDSDAFIRATRGAEFLFAPEVQKYLDRIYTVLVDLWSFDEELKTAVNPQRQELIQKRRAGRNELSQFLREFRELVAPYVQMHQKRLWF
jgi:hypothetical protein